MTATPEALLRREEETVEGLEMARRRLLDHGRAAMGVTGDGRKQPLLDQMRAHGVGFYCVTALGLLAFVDTFQSVATGTLAPEITRGTGISKQTFATILLLKSLSITLAALAMARIVQRKPRRALVAVVTGWAWSICTLLTGFVTSGAGLAAVNVLDGASSGSVAAVHLPLMQDSYPTAVRVRLNSGYFLFVQATAVVVPLMVAFLVGTFAMTWRGVMLSLGLLSLVAALMASGLKDPGFGRYDTAELRSAVRRETGEVDSDLSDEDVALGFWESVRRLLMMRTIRRGLVATTVAGMSQAPLITYFSFFLADKWHMGPAQRAVFGAVTPLSVFILVPLLSGRGERLFRRDPASLQRLGAAIMFAGIATLTITVLSPWFILMAIGMSLHGALPVALAPAFATSAMGIVPPPLRPYLIAMYSIAAVGVGGFAGVLLLGSVESRLGENAALLSIIVPQIIGGFVALGSARTINADLDRTVQDVIDEEELHALRSSGTRLPMLSCRHIDFSYGNLQVLFDVNLTVDDGEMVALLGTNGAGKSTLLRVISGIGLPARGTVRFRGADITYLDAVRRTRLGITQIPGGKAIFGPLTVVENLRVFAYNHGADRRAVDRGIDDSLAAFPRLAERRNQRASTLSGGEQQMLALSKALILRPRLLCIDELSLGLAPVIVADLLGMVRQINAAGTAVVLVEQSATIALSLADHAYFMERGQIRFDGAGRELLGRNDLLRSVFLHGAASAFSNEPSDGGVGTS